MKRLVKGMAALALFAGLTHSASATLTLTPAGTAENLVITKFAQGTNRVYGQGFDSSGKVFAAANGLTYLFPNDTDGQNGAPSVNNGVYLGMTTLNGFVYAVANGQVVQLNHDATINHTVLANASGYGLTADPINGMLYLANRNLANLGVLEINPTNGSTRVISTPTADGVSISPDGTTVYAAQFNQHVVGYRISDGAVVTDSDFSGTGGRPDGSAVGVGPLAGKLFATIAGGGGNGSLYQIDLTTNILTQIATSNDGGQGDFITVDSSNGTLLVPENDGIYRISLKGGGGFNSTPEPSTLVTAALGLLGALGVAMRRHRAARLA